MSTEAHTSGRAAIWHIFEGEDFEHRIPMAVNLFILTLIILNVVAVTLQSVQQFDDQFHDRFHQFEQFSVFVFSAEYLLRLWTCKVDARYAGFGGRLKWALTPMALVDLLAVAPAFLPFFVSIDMRSLRAFRLLRLFRLFKIGRYAKSLNAVARVMARKRDELFITMSVIVMALIISSSVVFYAEHEVQPETFGSIPHAMWWAVATLSTVGYGDAYPITVAGRLFAAVVAFLGIGLFSLPGGIIASGFLEEFHTDRDSPPPDSDGDADLACPHCGKSVSITIE